MEKYFIEIERIISDAVDTKEDLRKTKMEYIKQHRIVLAYFVHLQNVIEEEACQTQQ